MVFRVEGDTLTEVPHPSGDGPPDQVMADLAPGEYVWKPESAQGCWMDATSFIVINERLWEGKT